jgi:hypothetical protein
MQDDDDDDDEIQFSQFLIWGNGPSLLVRNGSA